MKLAKLDAMTLDELRGLRCDINAIIKKKKAKRRIPVKYRNPANPAQGWAGRGMRPVWAKSLSEHALEKCRV